ncbi:MAG: hypothetical protein ACREAS_10870 [Nitrososphaera sp.]
MFAVVRNVTITSQPKMSEATNYFSKAREFFDKANKEGEQEDFIQIPKLDDVYEIVHTSRAGVAYSFQGDKLIGIAFWIVVAT